MSRLSAAARVVAGIGAVAVVIAAGTLLRWVLLGPAQGAEWPGSLRGWALMAGWALGLSLVRAVLLFVVGRIANRRGLGRATVASTAAGDGEGPLSVVTVDGAMFISGWCGALPVVRCSFSAGDQYGQPLCPPLAGTGWFSRSGS